MIEPDLPINELIETFQRTPSNDIFEHIYDRYSSFVYRNCLTLTANEADAQDISQDIWINVYFGLEKFRFESSFSVWLKRITVNRCFNYLKKNKKLDFSDVIEEIENGTHPDVNHSIDVTKLLSQLSIQVRVLLTLKYIFEYSYEEIAHIAGIHVSAVKMRISRAKDKLIDYSLNSDSEKLLE